MLSKPKLPNLLHFCNFDSKSAPASPISFLHQSDETSSSDHHFRPIGSRRQRRQSIPPLTLKSAFKHLLVSLTFIFGASLLFSNFGGKFKKQQNASRYYYYAAESSGASSHWSTKAKDAVTENYGHVTFNESSESFFGGSSLSSGNDVRTTTEVAFFLEPYEFQQPFNPFVGHNDEFSLIFSPHGDSKDRIADQTTISEALNTLGAAAKSTSAIRAEKLYSHAMALQPRHPQVLIEFGLFVERVKSDLLSASTFYTKALILWPEDSSAKKHFARTLPLVEEIDSKNLRLLDLKRERFIHIPRGSHALRRLMRESYVEYIYHTVALEGNTMSLSQTRSILETHVAIGGKSVVEHNEILGLDAALRYLNSSLIHKQQPLTSGDILEVHRRVFGFVDPIEAGHFRRTQVFVGGFVPCMPDLIHSEMDEFIDWLGQDSTQRIHPVELAALVHYKFVIIHPFVDGNGRTARILMNLILMRAGFPPVIVKVEERSRYYETLKMANDGDLRPFIRFVAACTDRTLETYIKFTTEISQPGGDNQNNSNNSSTTVTSSTNQNEATEDSRFTITSQDSNNNAN